MRPSARNGLSYLKQRPDNSAPGHQALLLYTLNLRILHTPPEKALIDQGATVLLQMRLVYSSSEAPVDTRLSLHFLPSCFLFGMLQATGSDYFKLAGNRIQKMQQTLASKTTLHVTS